MGDVMYHRRAMPAATALAYQERRGWWDDSRPTIEASRAVRAGLRDLQWAEQATRRAGLRAGPRASGALRTLLGAFWQGLVAPVWWAWQFVCLWGLLLFAVVVTCPVYFGLQMINNTLAFLVWPPLVLWVILRVAAWMRRI